jgi:hypothetical protein
MALSLSKAVSKAIKPIGNKTLVKSVDQFILYNKYFLWVVLAFSLLNLLYMVVGRDYVSVIAFVLVGFLTSFFSKNMVVILLVAIVASNVIRFGARSLSEGMEGKEEEDEEENFEDEQAEDDDEEKKEKKEKKDKKEEKKEKNEGFKQKAKNGSGSGVSESDE